MIGVVAVSHSARLGEAALELALQMVQGGGVRVRVAAGAGTEPDGTPVLGTDAVAVAAAIDELATDCDGVLVLMDLGSAVLSAELALELRMSAVPVRLAPAPFVEGLLAAVVSAAAGGSLEVVAQEASAALGAKTEQLGDAGAHDPGTDADAVHDGDGAGAPPAQDSPVMAPDAVVRVTTVRNPLGIHARPAALIAEASAGADVRVRKLPDGPDAAAASLSRMLVLGARQGDEVELSASGPDAEGVLERLVGLFDDGFGEETGDGASPDPVPSPPSAATRPTDGEVRGELPGPVASGTVLRGRGVSGGRVAASVVTLAAPLAEPDAETVVAAADRESAVSAIERAAAVVSEDLRIRSSTATGEARAILDASRLLASDPELIAEASARVRTHGRTAARAVWEAALSQEKGLTALGGRMAERAADLRDVRDRLIAEILEVDVPGVPERDEPFVLVAVDLAPADTAALGGSRCVGLVTEQGGPTSHTAIIARSLGIPAVVGVAGAAGIASDTVVLLDGDRGTVEVEPDVSRVEAATPGGTVVPFRGEGVLADGRRVRLLANVGALPKRRSLRPPVPKASGSSAPSSASSTGSTLRRSTSRSRLIAVSSRPSPVGGSSYARWMRAATSLCPSPTRMLSRTRRSASADCASPGGRPHCSTASCVHWRSPQRRSRRSSTSWRPWSPRSTRRATSPRARARWGSRASAS